MKALIGLLLFIQGVETPYKPNNEFDVKIDVQVKARPYLPGDSDPKIDFSLSKDGFPDSKRKSGYLPHLTFNVKFLKLSEGEVKVRITAASGWTPASLRISRTAWFPANTTSSFYRGKKDHPVASTSLSIATEPIM